MPDNVINDTTREINGRLYTWQPDPQIQETMNYLGISREEAARMLGYSGDPADLDTPGAGLGSWVPGSYAHPGGQTGKILGLLALAGAGGGLAAGYAPEIGAALGIGGGGASGGTAAATAATTAAPSLAVTTGLPTSIAATLPGGIGTAGGLLSGAAAAVPTVAQATGASLPTGTGVPAGLPGSVPGSTGLPTATTGIPSGTALPSGPSPVTLSHPNTFLGTLKDIYLGKGKYGNVLNVAQRGLKALNSVEQGRALERAQRDQDAVNRYNAERANALVNFNAPSARAQQVMFGDMLRGYQPLTYANGKFSGGLQISDQSRQAGDAAAKIAMDRLLSDNPANLPTIPTPREPGGFDKALNIAGTTGDFLTTVRGTPGSTTNPPAGTPPPKSALDTLVDIFSKPAAPPVYPPPAASVRRAAPAAYANPDAGYAPRVSFAPEDARRAGRDDDPMSLINMPANQDLLGRRSRYFGK